MGRIQFVHGYDSIISVENLLGAWREFIRCKKCKADVSEFAGNLFGNIVELHTELKSKTYTHSTYHPFKINDPKPRDIHKATVRDRLLHHAIYRKLYPFFDRTFISDSYSCRKDKGTHRALNRFRDFAYRSSFGHTKTVWVLKCDIKKFFASIDHVMLLDILKKYIPDNDIIWLLNQIISSFHSTKGGIGLPLGNLTSQLLVNIYMNEFDQYIKHKLKQKCYIRYADDFVIMNQDRGALEEILFKIHEFLEERLKLKLHPDKVFIKTVTSGVDFLGWVHFSDHRVLRTTTKKRMFRNVEAKKLAGDGKGDMDNADKLEATMNSYLGMLSHGNAWKLHNRLKSL